MQTYSGCPVEILSTRRGKPVKLTESLPKIFILSINKHPPITIPRIILPKLLSRLSQPLTILYTLNAARNRILITTEIGNHAFNTAFVFAKSLISFT